MFLPLSIQLLLFLSYPAKMTTVCQHIKKRLLQHVKHFATASFLPLVNDRWMGKQAIHRSHKGHQRFKINGTMVKRQAQGHHLTNSNLLHTVLIGINARFFLQSSDCHRKNLRWDNLQQCGCTVLLPVNASDIGYRNAPLLQIRFLSVGRSPVFCGRLFFAFPESVFTRCFPNLGAEQAASARARGAAA